MENLAELFMAPLLVARSCPLPLIVDSFARILIVHCCRCFEIKVAKYWNLSRVMRIYQAIY